MMKRSSLISISTYLGLTISLTGLYALAVGLLHRFPGTAAHPWLDTLTVLCIVPAGIPLHGVLRRSITGILFPHLPKIESLHKVLGEELAKTLQMDKLVSLLREKLPAHVGITKATLLVRQEDHSFAEPNGGGVQLDSEHPILARLERQGALILTRGLRGSPDLADAPPLDPSWEILLPLRVGGRLIGIYTLGEKQNGGVYVPEEVNALREVSAQIGITLDNARLYHHIEEYNRELEEMVEGGTRELELLNSELAGERDMLNFILQNMYDGLLVTDQDHAIMLTNVTFEEILKPSPQDTTGRLLGNAVDCPPLVDLVTKAMNKPGLVLTQDFKHLQRILRGSSSALHGRTGVLTLVRDITDLKRVQEELRQAMEAAKAANQAKSEFLASMSHEIRTPMNAILGMADLLWESPLEPVQKQYVQVFRSAGETLLELINDILDLSKVEAGHLELERIPFDLNETLEKICDVLAMRAHEKGIELSFHRTPDVPNLVQGDPVRLRQILTNLIGNAIKFTQRGEVFLAVKLDAKSEEPGSIQFSVSDTGIGIPAHKLDMIFESFTQVDSSTTRKFGGTGLGLSISKRLIEMMGGRIWVQSAEGKGSVFHFTARLDAQPKSATDTDEPPEAILDQQNVLVMDDSATIRMILKGMLSEWGARVKEAENGKQGLEHFEAMVANGGVCTWVLVDLGMPGLDGFAVAETILKDSRFSGKILIMLPATHRHDDVNRCKQLDIGYVVKPVKQSSLREAITGIELGEVAPAADQGAAPEANLRPLRILLVEDSDNNRMLIKFYLKQTPYEIDIAENGQIGLEKFTAGTYDLVLMDIQMPVMDGYTATREIRGWEKKNAARPTPILALSANAFKEERDKSLEVGCSDYLTKPIKKATLLDAIHQHTCQETRVET